MRPQRGADLLTENRITVLVADDEPLVRKALALTVASEGDLDLVGSASDTGEAVQMARRLRPDVALVDVRMPGGGGIQAAQQIIAHSPSTRVIAFSAHSEHAIALEMVRAGAVAYIVKGSNADSVIDTIRRVARGETVLSAEIAGSVLSALSSQLQRQRDTSAERQRTMERLHDTIESRDFTIVFQPIVRLSSGAISGLEALGRFNGDPARGPERWFEEADSVGLRTALELATAGVAVRQLENLPDEAYLSLNFAPATLPLCFELAGAHGGRLVLEVTEHAAIADYGSVMAVLDGLRRLNARVAVDDAGAGFASLRHALQLAPDILKLDVSLTRGIDSDPRRRALAAGLIAFSRELGADVVAEGVETRAELVTLRSLGASHGQGRYLAPPAPLPAQSIRSELLR